MLPVAEAEKIILEAIAPLSETESITLEDSFGRVLAASVTGALDVPHWDNSAMDGYAIRAADLRDVPVTLEVIETIPAGQAPTKRLQAGQAARIFTGAMLPEGADTVVMQEHTRHVRNQVTIEQNPAPQQFVRHQGSYYQAGKPLLQSGLQLAAADLAVLAACQVTILEVFRRPRVSIFSTGNELRSPYDPLGDAQIVDSNRYALTGFCLAQQAIPKHLGIIPDKPNKLRAAMEAAIAGGDVTLSTGGVSVGEFDYIERLLEEMGGEILIRSVAIRPGKPLTVAMFPNNKLYFGLPGNPASALVGCWRFIRPALNKLAGLNSPWSPETIWAIAAQDLRGAGQREAYLWGTVEVRESNYVFHQAGGGHSSANLINLAQANSLAIIPPRTGVIPAGDRLRVMQV